MTRRLLTTQRIANLSTDPASGVSGEVYYNSTSNKLRFYNGTAWADVDSGGGGGGGASVTVADTAPSGSTGNLWFNSLNGKTYIYYDSYWIEIGGSSSNGVLSTDTALSNSWWLGV
jgi:hypothetical protein